MKKIHTLFAAAALSLAFTACQKEDNNVPFNEENITHTVVNPISGHASFAAGVDNIVKTTIADDGSQTWRAGDQILVSNGRRYISVGEDGALSASESEYNSTTRQLIYDSAVVAEWITITSEMISEDRKTLSFDVHVATPSSNYYFFVTGSVPHVYSMNGTGTVSIRRISEVSSEREDQDPQLIASCGKNDSHISFKNTLSFMSFKCATTDYYAATVIPNSGNGTTYKVNPDLSSYEISDNKSSLMKNAGVSAVINNNRGNWHLPLTAGYKFDGGFTFILWSSAADYETAKNLTINQIKQKTNWAGSPVFFSTTKDFTTTMGRVIDMEDIGSRVTYTSHFAMWEAGKSITIDGVDYNKYTAPFNGVSATRVTSDQNISAAGVYFVADGVTVTMSANISGSVIVMGDTVSEDAVGSRSATLSTNKQFNAGTSASLLLKGLTVNHAGNELFNVTNTDVNIIIDDCFIKTTGWKYLAAIADEATVGKFSVTNSDLIVRAGVINQLNIESPSTGSRTINALKVSNSVLSRSEGVGAAAICQGYIYHKDEKDKTVIDDYTTLVGNCVLSGNTFINFAHASSSYEMVQFKSVDTFTATNNYFYLAASGNQVNFYAVSYDSHSISGTHSTGYTSGIKYHMASSWPSDDTHVDSQFVDLDLSEAKPDFSLFSTTEYGAQR